MSDPFGPYGVPGYRDQLPPFLPGGYATLVSGSPVITTDQASKTIIYYAQDTHNAFPVIRNGTRKAVYFDEPRLVLSAAHAANTIYDVFGVERDGKGHLVSTPAWSNSGAGTGARDVAGSTGLARIGGALVNRYGLPGLNGDGSQFIPPGEGCYLFSIYIDGTGGQITCHRSYGQSRKWGLWNAYNRKPIALQAGDPTASWSYSSTLRQSRADTGNKLTVFAGLAEEIFSCRFTQRVIGTSGTGVAEQQIGIGVNSTVAISGQAGNHLTSQTAGGSQNVSQNTPSAHHEVMPAIGIQNINCMEATLQLTGGGSPSATYFGGNDDMLLKASWLG